MSQHGSNNYKQIIRQYQEQLVVMQVQIQALMTREADIWKENILKNLEEENLKYEIVGKFLADLKKEFGEGDNKIIKVVELKRIEQENRTMEEFV